MDLKYHFCHWWPLSSFPIFFGSQFAKFAFPSPVREEKRDNLILMLVFFEVIPNFSEDRDRPRILIRDFFAKGIKVKVCFRLGRRLQARINWEPNTKRRQTKTRYGPPLFVLTLNLIAFSGRVFIVKRFWTEMSMNRLKPGGQIYSSFDFEILSFQRLFKAFVDGGRLI